VWITPTISGTRPPPCSDFSLNGVTLNKAVLFGGYQHNLSQEELYIIDFDTAKMVSGKIALMTEK
jgi:predicted Ser/Thr protein kinase